MRLKMYFLSLFMAFGILLPATAIAQSTTSSVATTQTSTIVGMDDLSGAVTAVVEAAKTGDWKLIVSAILVLLSLIPGFGPVRKFLDKRGVDWLRPLIMTLGVGFAGFVAALAATAWYWAIVSGIVAALGSAAFQRFLKKAND